MNKNGNPNTSERGITLIALLVMIIILVILSAIVVKGITGNEGLIKTTTNVAEDHNIISYREQLEQAVRSIIIAYSARGEEPTIIELAEELEKEEWIISAIPNTDESLSSGDIIVVVDAGYIFDVFYDSLYGRIEIDYIGKIEDGEKPEDIADKLPKVTARYEKTITSIIAKATDETYGIAKIEIFYKTETQENKAGIFENPTEEVSQNVKDIGSGIYIVKATSNNPNTNQNTRYAYVYVANTKEGLESPIITLSPEEPDGQASWYKTAPIQVTIAKSPQDVASKEIHYTIIKEKIEEQADQKYETPFQITEEGRYTILAWGIDETEKYQSENATQDINIDLTAPIGVEIDENPISGTANGDETDRWYSSNVNLIINKDKLIEEHSGIKGYYYTKQKDGQDSIHGDAFNVVAIEKGLQITEEGITNIAMIVVDKAGNESTPVGTTIQIDKTPPITPSIDITEETPEGFKITVSTQDGGKQKEQSGIAYYDIFVKQGNTTVKETLKDTDGIFEVDGLDAGQTYTVSAIAYDKAGNEAPSGTKNVTIKGELLPPVIDVSGDTKNGYYTGEVNVTIRDISDEKRTRASKIKYNQNGVEYIYDGRSYSFTISQDGIYTLVAYTQDNQKDQSSASEIKTFTRDSTIPTVANIKYKSKTANTITVEAEGSDSTSGVKEYTYQYKIASNNDTDEAWLTATTKEETEHTYPSSLISVGQKYDLRVIVTDNAGNKRASSKITVSTNTAPVFTSQGAGTTTSNSAITINATATDADGDSLTYTLYWEDSSGNLSKSSTAIGTSRTTNII